MPRPKKEPTTVVRVPVAALPAVRAVVQKHRDKVAKNKVNSQSKTA